MPKRLFIICVALIVCMFSACGKEKANDKSVTGLDNPRTSQEKDNAEISSDDISDVSTQPNDIPDTDKPVDNNSDENELDTVYGNYLEKECFTVALEPQGDVRFLAFEPDTEKSEKADVIFGVQDEEGNISVFTGVCEDNIRADEVFIDVDAIYFPDYNTDGCSDIVIIVTYKAISGALKDISFQEVRVYSGNPEGVFTYQATVSNDINWGVADINLNSVQQFLSQYQDTSYSEVKYVGEDWKTALIENINNPKEADWWDGYELIYVDEDDIPELVKIGKDEASGCHIVNYSNGFIRETQLSRLYFTYIEKENLLCNCEGNMDCYYDIVYSILDGEMTVIAEGYYGAADNSNVQFDDNGNPIYEYEWNGIKVTQKDYQIGLNKVYDTSIQKDGYDYFNTKSADTVVSMLNQL